MYSQTLDAFLVKIESSTPGSGILYFPPAHPDLVLIFTAWHCIENTPISGLRITLTNQDCLCLDDGNCHILSFKKKEGENDLAVLVLPRTNFPVAAPEHLPFEFLNDFFDLRQGWTAGFPNANDGLKILQGEFRQMKPELPACFEVSTPREDLTTLLSDGLDNVEGMSGGGFFVEAGGIKYLTGILTRFSPDYKDFTCIKINKINDLLMAKGYAPLPYSFANSLGMNWQWFDRHLNLSIKSLGNRYTPELNFELPIAQIFEGLSRGKAFEKKVRGYFQEFLQALQRGAKLKEPEGLGIASYFEEKHSWIRQFFEKTKWSAPCNIQLEELTEILGKMGEDAYGFQRKIWDIQSEERGKTQNDESRYRPQPFESEENEIRKIIGSINAFQKQLWDNAFQLAQNPCLLLHGEAGSGKSHLFGDIADQKHRNGIPAVLVLGNKLQTRDNVWRQILVELEVTSDSSTFLGVLNSIGQHFGERVLFMIDALNEGEGKSIWKNELSSFIAQVKSYPYLGLALAVRDTYMKTVIPTDLNDSKVYIKVEHTAFEGLELSAVKHFARYFGLEQPRFPILAPEFSRPQLLLLLCRSLRDSGKRIIPEGLNGITTIYKDYLDVVNHKIAQKLDYHENLHLVRKGLERLAERMANNGSGSIEHLPAEQLFRELHPNYGSRLFNELLREGVLHEDRSWLYDKEEYVDVIRFNYERFGDFLAARHLLETHVNPKKPKEAFRGKGFFKEYFNGNYYGKFGIMKALAVLIPEKYNLELLELLPDSLLKDGYAGQEVANAFIDSLLWRRMDSINKKVIQGRCMAWVEKHNLHNEFYKTLLHLSSIPNHPYNADIFHQHNIRLSLAELDHGWSPFIHDVFRSENSAINRLLSWIWSDYDLSVLSDETRRLTATILTWTLTSSSITLRDTATLALVRLLSGYPSVTTRLLQQFEKVNDLYVRERLFAVALGVATNSGEHPDIVQLAQCVYDQIFREGIPPTHILLRDYARSVVEYALHFQLPIDVDAERIRPPYGSSLPLPYPTEEDIEPLKTDYKSEEFKKGEYINRSQFDIEHSVLGWDFNRYVITSEMRHFHSVALPLRKEYQEFKKNLPRGTKESFKSLEKVCKYLDPPHKGNLTDEGFAKFKAMTVELYDNLVISIEKKLPAEQKKIFRNKILHHLQTLNLAKKTGRKSTIEPQPIALWIFRRVFELGWRKDWHGEFDHLARDYSHRSEMGTERIGKKYQWIALHEILAMIADNHEVSSWNDKPEPYQGTWEPFVRNIDPTFPCLHPDSGFLKPIKAEDWWLPPSYDKWGVGDWLDKTQDLPDPQKIVNVTDPKGREWLNLHTFPSWREKEEFGVHEQEGNSWVIWYHLRSYLIKQKDSKKIHNWLLEQRFMNEWMPKQREHYEMFEKEYYWSPAYKDFKVKEKNSSNEGNNLWRQFRGSPYKGIVPIEEYGAGGGSYKNQGHHIIKPSECLWKQLGLRQGKRTGEFVDKNGELICFDPSVETDKPSCFLIRKDFFMDFLREKQLSLCWTLLGEKQIFHKPVINERFSITEFSGAYRMLPDGKIEGALRIVKER